MMEQGTIVSSEILPKVAKEFAKAARQGGALGEALKTVRVQQGKFLTASQKAQNTIFKSGFGEGLASFYQTMIQNLKELEPVLKVVGKLFNYLFRVISAGVNMLLSPLKVLGNLTDAFIDLDAASSQFAENTVPKMVAAGALMLTAWGRVLARFLAIKAVIEELIALSSKNVIGQIERDIGQDFGMDFGIGGDKINKPAEDINAFSRILQGVKDNASTFMDSGGGAAGLMSIINESFMRASVSNTIVVKPQPVIDHSGGLYVETAIEQSIVNGQAQR